jgi:hypothetical protein
MKISENLPQFKKRKALLVVTGKQEAVFYFVSNGQALELKKFRFSKPQYSDKEGYFERSGRGRIFGSGSVLESNKKKLTKDFIKELNNNLDQVSNSQEIEEIYLFAPGYIIGMIRESFPTATRKKLKQSYRGNYCGTHVSKILEKIKKKSGPTISKSGKTLQWIKKFRRTTK